jgi:hypothetical protein
MVKSAYGCGRCLTRRCAHGCGQAPPPDPRQGMVFPDSMLRPMPPVCQDLDDYVLLTSAQRHACLTFAVRLHQVGVPRGGCSWPGVAGAGRPLPTAPCRRIALSEYRNRDSKGRMLLGGGARGAVAPCRRPRRAPAWRMKAAAFGVQGPDAPNYYSSIVNSVPVPSSGSCASTSTFTRRSPLITV